MNNVIQFQASVLTTEVPFSRADLQLVVPDGKAFRLRSVTWKLRSMIGGNVHLLCALSRVHAEPVRPVIAEFFGSAKWLSWFGFGEDLTVNGMAAIFLHERQEYWDYDYRFVLAPTLHVARVFGSAIEVGVQLSGELVPVSQGERNAIIAWQGGPYG